MTNHKWHRNNTEELSCTNKRRYTSHHVAAFDAKQIMRKDPHGPHRSVYVCRFCNFVHVGSSLPRLDREAA